MGDLLDQAIPATVAIFRTDRTILLRPVWFEWRDRVFAIEIPAGDRKIAMLAKDPRISLLVAEAPWPYRAIQVSGTAETSTSDYHEVGLRICARYVGAARASDYLSEAAGVVVRVRATSTAAWDYADEGYV